MADQPSPAQGSRLETLAWKWTRYSGVMLIPLVFLHVALRDVIDGVFAIDLDYVARLWSSLGWRAFTFLLLTLAFSHGMNGFRQIANELIATRRGQRRIAVALLILWTTVTLIGAVAIVGGVRSS